MKPTIMCMQRMEKKYLLSKHEYELLDSQIGKEIHYMIHFYKPEPKEYIAYDCLAFKEIDNSSLRITFDSNMRSRFNHLDLSYGDKGGSLLENGECLMEIKVNQVYP